MSKLEQQRERAVERVKKLEKTAEEIHAMADNLRRKMEKLHLENIEE